MNASRRQLPAATSPRRVIALSAIMALKLLAGGLSFAEPTASQRIDASATVTFVGVHHRSWIVELDVAGPSTGVPTDNGYLDISLRSCVGQRCSAAAGYRHLLKPGEFTADQKASAALLDTAAFGQRIKLAWSTASAYRVTPTLVLYNHFVTGGGQAGVLIPAVRDAGASGSVFNRRCHPTDAQTAIETDAGNIPSTAIPSAPNSWPRVFAGLASAHCH